MTGKWPRVPLAKMFEPISRSVTPIPGITYRQLGVRLWGEGAYERESIDGAETKYAQLFRAQEGDLVANKIWARHGSVAVVQDSLAGCHGSAEFPMFVPDRSKVDPRWMHWLAKTRTFWSACDEKSRGTSGKNRISPERLLEIEIPLPPLAEQRRLVTQIERVADCVDTARTARQTASQRVGELYNRHVRALFPKPTRHTLGEFVRFQTGYAFKSDWFAEGGIRLVRNANIGHGTLRWSDVVTIPATRRDEFERFELRAGDILVALDRPVISTGAKVARVRATDLPALLLQRVARVVERRDDLSADYLFAWLRSPCFIDAIDPGRSNGVPHISHKDIEKISFELPSCEAQRSIVAAMDEFGSEAGALAELQARSAAELDALLPAVLDRAFHGELI